MHKLHDRRNTGKLADTHKYHQASLQKLVYNFKSDIWTLSCSLLSTGLQPQVFIPWHRSVRTRDILDISTLQHAFK